MENKDEDKSIKEKQQTFKTKLQETARLCEQLSVQLVNSRTRRTVRENVKTEENEIENISVYERDEIAKLQSQKKELEERIVRLEIKVKEVIAMNTKWQEYDKERNSYLQSLVEKLKETEDRVASASVSSPAADLQEQIDNLLLQSKIKVESIEKEKENIQGQCILVQKEKRVLEERLQTQERLMRQMQQQIEKNKQGQQQSAEVKEKIALLEQQVMLYEEDFKQENLDRERTESRAKKLQQELTLANQKLRQLTLTLENAVPHQARYAAYKTNLVPRGIYQADGLDEDQTDGPCSARTKLVPRGIYQADDLDEDQIDGPCWSRSSESHLYQADGEYEIISKEQTDQNQSDEERLDADNILECPNCHKGFHINQHAELLIHMDTCSEH